jgi:PLP dependent protein
MRIKENLAAILDRIPPGVRLVAVSKTKPIEDLQAAYAAGQRIFGENKIQEMASKWEQLPKDIEWHMIGHVQSNKVKYMAPFVRLIHAVDSLKLLKEIDKQAAKNKRTIDCLLQGRIAREETKFGVPLNQLEALYQESLDLPHVRVVGFMGMATFTDDQSQIEEEFAQLSRSFSSLQTKFPDCQVLSMGMSGDYALAIQQGSNMIRVGSSIFGERNY